MDGTFFFMLLIFAGFASFFPPAVPRPIQTWHVEPNEFGVAPMILLWQDL